ncbi:helix-turn-helix transcriptional regulator [Clostridium tertium]|uniref:helix-turn-helix domain-containing protein n=1 Tax=Clostridium tertium TaxID=1559 RepID=UPI00325B1051
MINLDYIKELRQANKVKTRKLATVIGVKTASCYSKKENGYLRFSIEQLKSLADFYSLSLETLFVMEGGLNDDK